MRQGGFPWPSCGVFHQAWGTAEHSDGEVLREVIDATLLADELGFDVAWFTEQHAHMFGRWWGRVPAPQLMMAHLAGRTRRIGLGSAVRLIGSERPARVAEELMLLDLLSGGRVAYGVGAGIAPMPEDGAAGREGRRVRFRQCAVDLAAILRDESSTGPGALALTPRDLSSRIYVAATDPRSVEVAAINGFGYLVGMFGGAKHPALVRRFRGFGGSGPVRATRMVYVDRDGDRARAVIRDAAEFFYSNFTPPTAGWREALLAAGQPQGLDDILDRLGWIVGGPEVVARRLAEYVVGCGLDGVDLSFHVPGLDANLACTAMEIFAAQSRPRMDQLVLSARNNRACSALRAGNSSASTRARSGKGA